MTAKKVSKDEVLKMMKRNATPMTMSKIGACLVMSRIECIELLDDMVTLGLIRRNSKGKYLLKEHA